MLAELFEVMFENPFLMIIFVVDLFLIIAIITFILGKVFGTKRPDKAILLFLKRFAVRHRVGTPNNIKELYDYVLDIYRKRGKINHNDGSGFKARKKILDSIEESEKKIIKSVFEGFEVTKYGGGLLNEKELVSYLLNQLRTL